MNDAINMFEKEIDDVYGLTERDKDYDDYLANILTNPQADLVNVLLIEDLPFIRNILQPGFPRAVFHAFFFKLLYFFRVSSREMGINQEPYVTIFFDDYEKFINVYVKLFLEVNGTRITICAVETCIQCIYKIFLFLLWKQESKEMNELLSSDGRLLPISMNFADLPDDVIFYLGEFLTLCSMERLSRVNKQCHRILRDRLCEKTEKLPWSISLQYIDEMPLKAQILLGSFNDIMEISRKRKALTTIWWGYGGLVPLKLLREAPSMKIGWEQQNVLLLPNKILPYEAIEGEVADLEIGELDENDVSLGPERKLLRSEVHNGHNYNHYSK